MGSISETTNLLNGLCVADVNLEDLASAEQCFAEEIAIHRKIGNTRGVNITRMNLAGVYRLEGRLADAARIYEQVIIFARNASSPETQSPHIRSCRRRR